MATSAVACSGGPPATLDATPQQERIRRLNFNTGPLVQLVRNPTRSVRIGSITIGAGHPVAMQSMTATPTQNVAATVAQVNDLARAGADVVRIAVDSRNDAEALAAVRDQTTANLAVDLQENYRLAEVVAPHVDKLRYNPGHLYHHEREKPWQDKVHYLADIAAKTTARSASA